MSARSGKPRKKNSRPENRSRFVKAWAGSVLLFTFAVGVLPAILGSLHIAEYVPSPAWLKMSTPYAWGAGILAAAAIFAAMVHMLRQEWKMRAGQAISWRERAYWLGLTIGGPAVSAFLVTEAMIVGFPMLLTTLVAAPMTVEYTFESSTLGSRGCSPMIIVQESYHKICGFSAPPSWRAGDTIRVTGNGSFWGVFVQTINWVRPAAAP